MAEINAIKSSERAGGFTHKAGSTLYQVRVYFDTASREPLEEKILRLIIGDSASGMGCRNRENAKNALTFADDHGTMKMPQMGRLPERGAL
jgi:hypothetical protein